VTVGDISGTNRPASAPNILHQAFDSALIDVESTIPESVEKV